MNEEELGAILRNLGTKRPIFHSEADFQHALAWAIHEALPDALIRPEYPTQLDDKRAHLDLWITNGSAIAAIELKYKTRKCKVETDGEKFDLRGDDAPDLGLYDFLKDVQRMEQFVAKYPIASGYAIIITNHSGYWTFSETSTSADSEFRLWQGRTIQGELNWGNSASEGTKQYREKPISLAGKYTLNWEDYSYLEKIKNQFRSLTIKVVSH